MDTPNPAARSVIEALAAAQGLYIGGAWRAATGGATIPVLNPSTERVLAQVPDATLEDAAARGRGRREGRVRMGGDAPAQAFGNSAALL